ncbi:uncharacterized protein LJ206_015171 isoform 1-T1 [Theristicus caerulescens]
MRTTLFCHAAEDFCSSKPSARLLPDQPLVKPRKKELGQIEDSNLLQSKLIPSSRQSERTEGRGPVTFRSYSKANVHLNLPTAKCMPLKVMVWQSWSVNSSGGGFPTPTLGALSQCLLHSMVVMINL